MRAKTCDPDEVMHNLGATCYMDSLLFSLLYDPTNFIIDNLIKYDVSKFPEECKGIQKEIVYLTKTLNALKKSKKKGFISSLFKEKCNVENLLLAFKECKKIKSSLQPFTSKSIQSDVHEFYQALTNAYTNDETDVDKFNVIVVKQTIKYDDEGTPSETTEFKDVKRLMPGSDLQGLLDEHGVSEYIEDAKSDLFLTTNKKGATKTVTFSIRKDVDYFPVFISREIDPTIPYSVERTNLPERLMINMYDSTEKSLFQLDKIIVHIGDVLNRGHYIVFYRCNVGEDERQGKWMKYNDLGGTITPVDGNGDYDQMLKQNAGKSQHPELNFKATVLTHSRMAFYRKIGGAKPKIEEPKGKEEAGEERDREKAQADEPKGKEEAVVTSVATKDITPTTVVTTLSVERTKLLRDNLQNCKQLKISTVPLQDKIGYLNNVIKKLGYQNIVAELPGTSNSEQYYDTCEDIQRRIQEELGHVTVPSPKVPGLSTSDSSISSSRSSSSVVDSVSEQLLEIVPHIPKSILFEDLPDPPKPVKLPDITSETQGWAESCEVQYVNLGPSASQLQQAERQVESKALQQIETDANDEGKSVTAYNNHISAADSAGELGGQSRKKFTLSETSPEDDKGRRLLQNVWLKIKDAAQQAKQRTGIIHLPGWFGQHGGVQQAFGALRRWFVNVKGAPNTPQVWNSIRGRLMNAYGGVITRENAKKRALKFTRFHKRDKVDEYTPNDYGLISAIGGTQTLETLAIQTGVTPTRINQILEIVEPLPNNIAFKPKSQTSQIAKDRQASVTQFTPVYKFLDNMPVATVVLVLTGGNAVEGLYLKVGRKRTDNRWTRLNKLLSDEVDSSVQNEIWYSTIGKFIIPLLQIQKDE